MKKRCREAGQVSRGGPGAGVERIAGQLRSRYQRATWSLRALAALGAASADEDQYGVAQVV